MDEIAKRPLTTLYSIEEVLDMFPASARPSKRTLVSRVKQIGCCCKLGRGLSFTQQHVEQLLENITTPNQHAPRQNIISQMPKRDNIYETARAALLEVKQQKPRKRILIGTIPDQE